MAGLACCHGATCLSGPEVSLRSLLAAAVEDRRATSVRVRRVESTTASNGWRRFLRRSERVRNQRPHHQGFASDGHSPGAELHGRMPRLHRSNECWPGVSAKFDRIRLPGQTRESYSRPRDAGVRSRWCSGITSFCEAGGGGGIRTHGTRKGYNGFRDRPVRPLRHPLRTAAPLRQRTGADSKRQCRDDCRIRP